MGAGPDAQPPADADILLPVEDEGARRMPRVAGDQANCADRLCVVRERERGPGPLERGVSLPVSAVLVALACWATVIAIAPLARAF